MADLPHVPREPFLHLYSRRVHLQVDEQSVSSRVDLDAGEVLEPPEREVQLQGLLGDVIAKSLGEGLELGVQVLQRIWRLSEILTYGLRSAASLRAATGRRVDGRS